MMYKPSLRENKRNQTSNPRITKGLRRFIMIKKTNKTILLTCTS